MKVNKRAAVTAALIAAGVATIPALAAPNRPQGGSQTLPCNDGNVTWTPTNLWPPNHKLVPVSITYNDSDSDANETTMVSVGNVTETDGTTTNNALVGDDLNGSGAPGSVQGPDAVTDPNSPATSGSDGGADATWTEDLRAERSGTDGHGGGRVYDLQVTCTDSPTADAKDTGEATGESQTIDITVTVPHDQGN